MRQHKRGRAFLLLFPIFSTVVLSIQIHLNPVGNNVSPYSQIEQEYQTGDRKTTSEDFLNSLMAEGLANSQDVLGDMLTTIKENDKRAQETPSFTKQCNKDYTGACPEGWKHKGTGFLCTAPAAYKGPCATVMNFAMDREKKSAIEQSCQLSWPCLDSCSRDFDILCPSLWTATSGMVCQAPWFYSDRCERKKDFTHFTAELKETWSKTCNVIWPCQQPCKRDYNAACPDGWKFNPVGNVCTSPVEYQGPCGPEESISLLDYSLRVLFEERCHVAFPCIQQPSCRIDFSSLCPEDWVATVDDEGCVAPAMYSGVCERKLFLSGYTIDQKKALQDRCGVTWPCQQECIPTYTEPCPLNWVFKPELKKGEGLCIPLQSFKGLCLQPRRLWAKTREMKIAFARHCKAPWPCFGEAPEMVTAVVQAGPHVAVIAPHVTSSANGPVDEITGEPVIQTKS